LPPLFNGKLGRPRHTVEEHGAFGIAWGERTSDYRHLDPAQRWTARSRYVRVHPIWLTALTAPLPVFWLYDWFRRLARRDRIAMDRCTDCGYDLRATPEGGRCPECGRDVT
jgi:hypothetical protein